MAWGINPQRHGNSKHYEMTQGFCTEALLNLVEIVISSSALQLTTLPWNDMAWEYRLTDTWKILKSTTRVFCEKMAKSSL